VAEIVLADKITAGSTLLRSVGGLIDRLKISDEFEGMSTDELRDLITSVRLTLE
jgi:hypothetical protein